jgi:hypothetical protein
MDTKLRTGILLQRHRQETDQKEWALVSKSDRSKVLEWYGPTKPSQDQVNETERRVKHFSEEKKGSLLSRYYGGEEKSGRCYSRRNELLEFLDSFRGTPLEERARSLVEDMLAFYQKEKKFNVQREKMWRDLDTERQSLERRQMELDHQLTKIQLAR